MSNSIQSRLILSASLVLLCFLGLAGAVLDMAYQNGVQQALHERLQIQLYSMLAEAELNEENQFMMRSALADPRFRQVDSDLYAYVFSNEQQLTWRSPSAVGLQIKPLPQLATGVNRYLESRVNEQPSVALHYRAILEGTAGRSREFEFIVIESQQRMNSQVAGFRSVLWQWLGGVAALLILTQFVIIRKSLQPLRLIVNDLESIQQGDSQQLANDYSDELKELASMLNKLIVNERTHLKRYRDTLADLAHSLKTPLSVLTGLYTQGKLNTVDIQMLKTQTQQMRQLVDYQLQKAAAKGHQTLAAPLALEPIIQQIINSLNKVYMDKQLTASVNVSTAIKFSAERGDLYELLGNLLDNAYKWADSAVTISVQEQDNSGIKIVIEDDGPGIPAEQLAAVLQRGIRADEAVNGQGIGLAVINELVRLYKGTLTSKPCSLGGQHWEVYLPKKA
ncbi:MAG: ATP-binding protein [Cycloclasticus sp.]